MLYTGKAKLIFAAEDPDHVVVHYKDDTTAYNGIKRAQITNKGVLNNKISAIIYRLLEQRGIKTHFVKLLNDREQLCKRKTEIIKLEFIVRNIAAGSMSKRLHIKEGTQFPHPVYEICYKNDDLGDPIINNDHAVVLGLSTYQELTEIHLLVKQINEHLIDIFKRINISLVDVKIEFGRTSDGTLVLADEISPDTARLWDITTLERLDRDRFRRDMGRITEAYDEILTRLSALKD
ncbi:MAG: phosphoribosylaminoimidazolesuccinocarboxamide synthase [Prevotellaceae bacterium]|nr:phosphoribosylaminoimidazolesuccinocarboxamide synthase [Prevotellaceae bacterium]